MANELVHATADRAAAGKLTQSEFDSITAHRLNSQAIGDIIYASTTTQLRRLGIGSAGQPLTVVGGVPAWGGNVALGANKLTTTNYLLKEETGVGFACRTGADDAYMDFKGIRIWFTQALRGQGAATYLTSDLDTDAAALIVQARDTGVGGVEVARGQGAADPEFKIGNDGNALRGSYAGYLGFFGTAPQAKPTGVAVTAAGIHAALVTVGLIAA